MADFELVSSKTIFRVADMTEVEQDLWIEHLDDQGFRIDDSREIFEPFEGESTHYVNEDGEDACFLNEDIGTQELRIRYWKWTDLNGIPHELIDMNAWPGDNESGLITFDGTVMLKNDDQNLDWSNQMPDRDKEPNVDFEPRLDFFAIIRCNLIEEYECWKEELEPEVDAFFKSAAGQAAIQIESVANDKYSTAIDAIRVHRRQLMEQHQPEFKLTQSLPILSINHYGIAQSDLEAVFTIADQLGYTLHQDCVGRYHEWTRFFFVDWTPTLNPTLNPNPDSSSTPVRLVTIREHHTYNTYLLTPAGKIGRQMYKGTYLGDDFDPNDPIMVELVPRIHAYLEVVRNH